MASMCNFIFQLDVWCQLDQYLLDYSISVIEWRLWIKWRFFDQSWHWISSCGHFPILRMPNCTSAWEVSRYEDNLRLWIVCNGTQPARCSHLCWALGLTKHYNLHSCLPHQLPSDTGLLFLVLCRRGGHRHSKLCSKYCTLGLRPYHVNLLKSLP